MSNQYQWKIGKGLPDLGTHSLAKHRILKRYVERYIEIVTAKSVQEGLKMTFVDGYCGGGRYQLGREQVAGSPFLFLEAVAAAEAKLNQSRSKGFRIDAEFVFIDEKKHHTDFLRAELERSPFKDRLDKSIHIWTGDFNNRVADAIRIAKGRSPRAGRAIFLLDQFGWSQVAFRSIRTILGSLNKAEVFLTFLVDNLINYLSENSFDMRAFGEIDMDPAKVRELVRIKESEQVGYRALIQHGLYAHVQAETGAPFYSPFFVKSLDSYRSYWFIHLSKHREARNEIGMIHWAENNTTCHHGGAGLNALGYTPGKGIDQLTLDYVFDEQAKVLSRKALHEQLPRLIYDAVNKTGAPTLEEIFAVRCNDTPVVRESLEEVVTSLRDLGELSITDINGRSRPRATSFGWTDRISLSSQRSFFGPFSNFHPTPQT